MCGAAMPSLFEPSFEVSEAFLVILFDILHLFAKLVDHRLEL